MPDTLAADDAVVFMAIMRALGSESVGRKVADLDAKATAVGGGLGIAKANVALERVRKTHDLAELLSDSVATGAWNGKALVVTIDELQTVSAAGMGTLRVLHQGVPDCPLMVLGIGLQHTPEVLSNPQGNCRHFKGGRGVQPWAAVGGGYGSRRSTTACWRWGTTSRRLAPRTLAEASMGFPQHVHGYLAGACEAISRHGRLTKGAPLTEAIAIGDKARVAYYEGRLRLMSNSRAMLAVIAAMAQRANDSLDIDTATKALDDASFDGASVVREAIEHGVLTRNARSELSFGIPSFHAYMEDWMREEERWSSGTTEEP